MKKINFLLCSVFILELYAEPQMSESFNKLQAKHLSKASVSHSKNYNYVEIRSSADLKKFIKDGCINVGIDTTNNHIRGKKINYVSIRNVKLDTASFCNEFSGINFGIISDDLINSKLTNIVKIRNSKISDSVNAGIIVKSNRNNIQNLKLQNNVLIKRSEFGTKRELSKLRTQRKNWVQEKHKKFNMKREHNEEEPAF